MVIRLLGSWQNFTASDLHWDGEPYLDNPSYTPVTKTSTPSRLGPAAFILRTMRQ